MIVNDDRYEVEKDPYCYDGTDVLKNKANLRDATLLRDFELEMSLLRSREPLPDGTFNPVHYRAVHHHLLQDVYEWAGEYRGVRMTRGSSVFCYPEFITPEIDKLFCALNQPAFLGGAKRADFIAAASVFLAELNAIHCFRDGNGRAQLTFLHLIAKRAGHAVHLARVKRDTFLPAMIASFNGDLAPLREQLATLCRRERRR